MKAIILAAGKGNRFGPYTNGLPKSLLEIGGMSILERQIRTLRRFDIDDIVVVKGFAAEKINFDGVRYYIVEEYWHNMVYSLFCAEPEIYGDVIISYADILFDDSVLHALLSSPSYDIGVVVDTHWEDYYRERFNDPFNEAESLICNADGHILELGMKNPPPSNVQAQYIGLMKLSNNGCSIFRHTYLHAKEKYWDNVWLRGRIFQKIYMTDFLQAIIDSGESVYAIPIENGWLEFDNVTDYEKVLNWYSSNYLDRFCVLDL